MGRRDALCLVLAAVACARSTTPTQSESRALPGTTVAEVGSRPIDASTVERIATNQKLEPRAALANAVVDALFAAEASERVPSATSAAIGRAALSRALLEDLARKAMAAGPATDAEVEQITAERWVDLDRPEAVRVTHAIALRPKLGDPLRARKVAEAIRDENEGVLAAEGFVKSVELRPKSDVEVRVERLTYITADGRGFSGEGPYAPANRYDESFARAANALKKPGDLSPVVETSFGYHVIYLEARLPARRIPLEDRRRALQAEVLSRRAAAAKSKLVTGLAKVTPVEVRRDVDELTAQLVR